MWFTEMPLLGGGYSGGPTPARMTGAWPVGMEIGWERMHLTKIGGGWETNPDSSMGWEEVASLRERCQVRLGPSEHEALGHGGGHAVGPHPRTSPGSDSSGPLSGACGWEQLPRGKGPPSSWNLRHPSMEPLPLPLGPPGSISALECASGGRDVGLAILK